MTAFELAQRFIGVRETPDHMATPLVLAMLKLDAPWPDDDAVPWCSAFVNFVTWLLRLPRSKSLLARSWLNVGQRVDLKDATVGNDVVIFARNAGGHVGFYAGRDVHNIFVLGGNQHDAVNVSPFDPAPLLGVRRLA